MKDVNSFIKITDNKIKVTNKDALRTSIDELIFHSVFNQNEDEKNALLRLIIEAAKDIGIIPSSIQNFYKEIGKGRYKGFTVPAINIRGLTYDVARIIFKKAMEMNVGAFIFEIARSEIGYTAQRPLEYSAVVLAAAIKEGYEGHVFIQGDHFQISNKKYLDNPEKEVSALKELIAEAIDADFYNIDIDASTTVDLSKPTVDEQQRPNYTLTANLTDYIRKIEPKGITVSVGGEIGEIGKANSTEEELKAFLSGFNKTVKSNNTGLSKISVQTGTSHGGVVLPDGTLAQVKIDFETLKRLSNTARTEYGLAGAVQHGASTLPESAFGKFVETGCVEVHLATGFQNIIYDSKYMPSDLKSEIYEFIKKEFAKEKKENQTGEQFIYSTRKKGFGPFKKRWWELPSDIKSGILSELEERFGLLFEKLNVVNTKDIVNKAIHKKAVPKAIPKTLISKVA
ncbi:MAG: class II fructose-bisphosphate aldolase [Nitrospirae bacterium]|nr:class II fructose-bisphosphate aldolase [Nitrospirota bacterium]